MISYCNMDISDSVKSYRYNKEYNKRDSTSDACNRDNDMIENYCDLHRDIAQICIDRSLQLFYRS